MDFFGAPGYGCGGWSVEVVGRGVGMGPVMGVAMAVVAAVVVVAGPWEVLVGMAQGWRVTVGDSKGPGREGFVVCY